VKLTICLHTVHLGLPFHADILPRHRPYVGYLKSMCCQFKLKFEFIFFEYEPDIFHASRACLDKFALTELALCLDNFVGKCQGYEALHRGTLNVLFAAGGRRLTGVCVCVCVALFRNRGCRRLGSGPEVCFFC